MIVTFKREDRPDLYDIYYRELLIHAKIGKNDISNYSIKNMDLDAQLAFSIAYQTTVDCPFGLSSIYRRDYWESGVYRILNRTWKPLGEYDENVTMALNPLWTDMMKSQIEWLQENTNDYRASIISRKHPSINSSFVETA